MRRVAASVRAVEQRMAKRHGVGRRPVRAAVGVGEMVVHQVVRGHVGRRGVERAEAELREAAQRELASDFGSSVDLYERDNVVVVSSSRPWEPFQRDESAGATWFIWGRALQSRQTGPREALDLSTL